ncbi:hypothetical protein [Pseudomonas serbica]|uniref:hypothetical protein n=1 Tax=Pseudomonas serbica TaxID=2965074 RepID=UPI00237C15F3|nr:hypothetical protein [Pseudomonas serbica]
MPGTDQPKLNVVDQLVKQALLRGPSMYGSRLSVLSSVFFTGGNGYFWNNDGTLGSRYPAPTCTEMKFSDLDSPPAPASALDVESEKFITPFELVKQARHKRLRAIRTLIAEDIDLYARYNLMGDTLDVESLRNYFSIFELDRGLIATAPYEVLDHDWARAMMELLNEAIHTLGDALRVRDSSFSRETANPQLLGYYDKIEELIGKVAKVPGLYNKSAIQGIIDLLEKAKAKRDSNPSAETGHLNTDN